MSNTLTTERLLLRRWRDEDREPFAALNADPEVMRFFPAPLSRADSDATVDRFEAGFDQHGFGLWALEETATGAFLGFTGLNVPSFDADFMPAVEVGWRLARTAWGNGYATEAARAAITYGFSQADLDEIVSFTSVPNVPSQAVMRRLGMIHVSNFDHPRLPTGHRLSRHVLYRLHRTDWSGQ
jgi:RimJ/RimL family protein N-acetyltransferase